MVSAVQAEGVALCPGSVPAKVVGHIGPPELDEASGLAASRANPGLWWSHNDSFRRPVLFALDEQGGLRGRVELGIDMLDWEDLALGPDGRGGYYLYLADTGNNLWWRRSVRIYRLPEPRLPLQQAGNIEGFSLIYPDGRHDAESMLVDPRDGELYVLTKENDYLGRQSRPAVLYRLPRPLVDGGIMVRVAEIDLPALAGRVGRAPGAEGRYAGLASSAAISPAGDALVVLTYTGAWLWQIGQGESLEAALARRPCHLLVGLGGQSEAFGFGLDGGSFMTTSEGKGAALFRGERSTPTAPSLDEM